MANINDRAKAALKALENSGRLRSLKGLTPVNGARVRRDGVDYINFASNDYLGLAQHPAVIERAKEWTDRFGAGSGASRLVTGHLDAVNIIEAKIAKLKGKEAALLFASGWQCNASALPALLDRTLWDEDVLVFTDRLIHASLHAGLQIAGNRQIRFRHNDMDHLRQLLAKHDGPKLIVTESVFSMDGDIPDMQRLSDLAQEFNAVLYVDEAHASGVMGRQGMGLCDGLDVDCAMGTFSKGLGSFGAYIACSQSIKDWLINRASGFIYATALPPGVLGAIDAALDLVPEMEAKRQRLAEMGQYVRNAFKAAGLSTADSQSQIIPVLLGEEQRALSVAKLLETQGILAVAIRPPTVPPGTSRIRFTLSLLHTQDDLDQMIAATLNAVRQAS